MTEEERRRRRKKERKQDLEVGFKRDEADLKIIRLVAVQKMLVYFFSIHALP